MNIEITQAAKDKLADMVNSENCMRISLVKSGCCNFSFLLYKDIIKPGDFVSRVEGIRFVMTENERILIEKNGITIDYGKKGIVKDFRVIPG